MDHIFFCLIIKIAKPHYIFLFYKATIYANTGQNVQAQPQLILVVVVCIFDPCRDSSIDHNTHNNY